MQPSRVLAGSIVTTICLLTLTACPADHTTPCGDQVCRQGYSCDPIHDECVVPAQLEVCVGEPDGAECLLNGANGFVCDQEVCLQSVCGDGMLDVHSGEDCDDGNTVDDDACPNDCTLSICGDALLGPGEDCDGSDLNSQTCDSRGYDGGQLTCGGDCLFDDSLCSIQCGNGLIHTSETCDDGNNAPGDGCSELCQMEEGWDCQGTPSVCVFGYATIVTGGAHACGLYVDGTVYCWGLNGQGQLGNGGTTDSSIPVQVSGLSGVVAITAGGWHTCALLDDDTVWCWGLNNKGQLGDGNTTDDTTPTPLPVQVSGLSGVQTIVAGGAHNCAVQGDDSTWCWGFNEQGQLGDNSTIDRPTPVQVSGLSGVDSIAAGGWHTCAVRSNNTVWCWGSDLYGQLGDGNNTDSSIPVPVNGPFEAVSVVTGGGHTCAIKSDTTIWCWGWNNQGQLGDGNSPTSRNTPLQVNGSIQAASISVGLGHTCVTHTNGTAWCWGWNEKGQLGDDSVVNKDDPVQVSGISGAGVIVAGGEYTCVSIPDGTARCWGWNFHGQLGDETTVDRHVPVVVTMP